METLDKVSDFAHETAEKVASAASHAAETLGETGEQLKNAEKQLMKNCRAYISDHPMTSVGIAATFGFLLSRLLSRR